jgi:hypothetical protein
MKKQVNFLVWTVSFVSCLFGLIAQSPSKVFAQSVFQVEGVGVEASPTEYNGVCPGTIKFNSKIQANGAGRVKYTWLRNDGATAPVEYVDFTEAGIKYVSTTWTLGDAIVLPSYSGWQQIKILSPNEMISNQATFKLTCKQSGGTECNEQSRIVSWAGTDLGDGNAINATGAPDSQTRTIGSMELGRFRGGRSYPGLAALLGIPDSTLARADVIAFELNGGHAGESGGFESSRWIFNDGINPPHTVNFDATRDWRTISSVIANGTINIGSASDSGRNYSRFFGIRPEVGGYVSYILFDLPPGISTASPAFSVRVSSFTEAGEGTPDVDAIGILACPTNTPMQKKVD